MSYSASTIGLPVFARFEIGQTGSVQADFLGQLEENAARSCAVVFCHGPKSKASRADFTAASTLFCLRR